MSFSALGEKVFHAMGRVGAAMAFGRNHWLHETAQAPHMSLGVIQLDRLRS